MSRHHRNCTRTFKGRAFAKGHVIQEEDIEKLLNLGKRHIYVWDLSKGYVHENDAALRMVQAAAGENIVFSEVKEGKSSCEQPVTGC